MFEGVSYYRSLAKECPWAEHQSYYRSLAKECPWAEHKSAKEGDGQSFTCFHMYIATKERPCHVCSDSNLPGNTYQIMNCIIVYDCISGRQGQKKTPPLCLTHFHFQLTTDLMSICVWSKRSLRLPGLHSNTAIAAAMFQYKRYPSHDTLMQSCKLM